jgi:hypothetical protein
VTRLAWPSSVSLGEPVTVAGTIGPGRRVKLAGPGGPSDSTSAGPDGRFRMADLPRNAGRYLYVLEADGAAPETLGVHVTPPVPPRVLVIAGAPSFEARALREWLARGGGVVAVRTAVSRERWHTQFINREPTALVPLTGSVLDQFDVAVTDARTLADLPAREQATLERAIRETGLGLVVIGTGDAGRGTTRRDASPASAIPHPSSLLTRFVTTPIPELGERSVRPVLAGIATPQVAVPAEAAALRDGFAVETVLRDGAGVGIVQAAPRGAGTVALSLVDGTSRWLRAGEPGVYASYWSRVLRRTARAPVAWRAADAPRVVDRPVILTGPADRDVLLVVAPSGARDSVYVAADPLDPARARGTYWPRDAGWHEAAGAVFHVRGAGAWAGVDAGERVAATARAIARAPLAAAAPPAREERRPVPLTWAFVLFVLATGYLWMSRR